MPRADQEQQIEFGPGGRISDNTPQNRKLLDELKGISPLSSGELLKLAKFYKAYPTNLPLGNHLALLALATKEGEPAMQEVLTEYVDTGNFLEDIADAKKDESKEMKPAELSVRIVPVSGIRLLIETFVIKVKSGTRSLSFVIGVSPAP